MLLYSFIWLLSLLFFVKKIGLSIVTSDTLNCPRLFILIKTIEIHSNPAIPTGLMEKHTKNLLQCQIFLCF